MRVSDVSWRCARWNPRLVRCARWNPRLCSAKRVSKETHRLCESQKRLTQKRLKSLTGSVSLCEALSQGPVSLCEALSQKRLTGSAYTSCETLLFDHKRDSFVRDSFVRSIAVSLFCSITTQRHITHSPSTHFL